VDGDVGIVTDSRCVTLRLNVVGIVTALVGTYFDIKYSLYISQHWSGYQ